jgi:hypothetical protein
MVKDGLWDVYNDFAMGVAADQTAEEHGISREASVGTVSSFLCRLYPNNQQVLLVSVSPLSIGPRTIVVDHPILASSNAASAVASVFVHICARPHQRA